jgi:hypothetical protein
MNLNRSFNRTNSTVFGKYDSYQIIFNTIDTFGLICNMACVIVAISIIINKKNSRKETILHFRTQTKRQGWYLLLLSSFYFYIFLIIIINDIKKVKKASNQTHDFLFIIVIYSEPFSNIISSWILVAFSFDMLNNIVTHRPELTKIHKLLNPKYLFVFILFIIIPLYIGLVFPIYYSQFYQTKITNTTKNMSINKFNRDVPRKIINSVLISMIYVSLNSIIPYILIGISTKILVKKIFKRRESYQSIVHRKKFKFVVRIIFMNLIFIICNLPSNFLIIYSCFCVLFNLNNNGINCYSGKFIAVYSFFSYQIYYTHRALLLIILLFTNKLFRKHFFKIFCCRKS